MSGLLQHLWRDLGGGSGFSTRAGPVVTDFFMAEYQSLLLELEQALEQAALGTGDCDVIAHIQAAHAAGVDVNDKFPGRTTFALAQASLKGLVNAVEALLAAGASVDQTSADGDCTDTWYYSHGQHPRGASQHRTCLVHACWFGHVHCTEMLLAAGASPEGVEGADETPLTAACGKGHLACVQALLAAGAGVNKASDTGKTPLCAACNSAGHVAVVEALVAAGADINKPECDLTHCGQSDSEEEEMLPLVCAIQAGALDVVRLLLSSGATITNGAVEAAKDEGAEFEDALEAATGTVDSDSD
jgi:ankyrin repeat protein